MLSDEEIAKLALLPTGKPHISFSEFKNWVECSYRHNLLYVKKIDLGKPSSILEFGTGCHASCEDWLPTRVMRPEVCIAHLEKTFDEHKGEESFEPETFELMVKQAKELLPEVPPFFDETWPGWQHIKAEHYLYEPLSVSKPQHAFKGFIDAVITVPTTNRFGKTKDVTWILDYKTTNSYWSADKKSNPLVTGQLMSYKHYYMQEMGIHPSVMKNVKTGFVLLKRQAKPGKHIELVTVSVGEKTMGRTLKTINNCVSSVSRGIAMKNRDNCRWCPYKGTEHCK